MAGGAREFFWVAVPKSLGGVLMLLLNALLLRFLEPAAFGAYSLCVAGILAFDAVIGSAFDLGTVRLAPQYREIDPPRAAGVEKASLLLKFALALVAVLAIALFADPLGLALLHDAALGHLLVLSGAGALALLMLRSGLVYLQVRGEFVLYGKLEMLHSVLKYGGIALLVLLVPADPAWIMVLFALAPACALLMLARRLARDVFSASLRGGDIPRELVSYVKWFFLTFGVAALVGRVDLFLVTGLSGLGEAGLFSGAQVYALIPELLGTYLAVVLSPRIMPLLSSGRFYPFFRRVQGGLLLVAAMGMALAIPVINHLAPLLLPDKFAPSAQVLLILLPGALASFITFPLTLPFLMFLRPRLLLTVDIVTAPVLLAAYVLAIGEHGAVGAAWVTTVSRLCKAGLAQFVAWRLARSGETGSAITQENEPQKASSP